MRTAQFWHTVELAFLTGFSLKFRDQIERRQIGSIKAAAGLLAQRRFGARATNIWPDINRTTSVGVAENGGKAGRNHRQPARVCSFF